MRQDASRRESSASFPEYDLRKAEFRHVVDDLERKYAAPIRVYIHPPDYRWGGRGAIHHVGAQEG